MDERSPTLRGTTQITIGAATLARAWRLCIASGVLGAAASAAAADTTRVIVAYKEGSAARISALIAVAPGAVRHPIADTNAFAVELPAAAIAALKRDPNVAYVEEDHKRYPLAVQAVRAGQRVPYGIPMVQADLLPDTRAANRKICIIDSGYDRAHEDLSGNSVRGEFDQGTGWWFDDSSGHGTHVAGTMVAINNATGVVGVAGGRKLKLHIVKVFGPDGWAYSSTLASAAMLCAKAGAHVISMSLGGPKESQTEMLAFQKLQAKGVLSVAAAGNDGNTNLSYPAGYATVVMVGALDAGRAWAGFSQYNAKVELSGPGVGVLSTVPMDSGADAALSVGGAEYAPLPLAGSPRASASAPLAHFGMGDARDPAMAGKLCLIKRGAIDFGLKVANCEHSGGVGAVLFNNVPEAFAGTLGATVTSVPSVSVSGVEGGRLLAMLGQDASLKIVPASYAAFDGTSMATPHVAAVAALVWSYCASGCRQHARHCRVQEGQGPRHAQGHRFAPRARQAQPGRDRFGRH